MTLLPLGGAVGHLKS